MWRSIALLFGLLALVLGSEGNNYGCATGLCDQDGIFNFGNPDKSSMATNKPVVDNSEGVNGEPSKQATELSTTPASSSRFPSTTSIPDTTSTPGSSTASTATSSESTTSTRMLPTTPWKSNTLPTAYVGTSASDSSTSLKTSKSSTSSGTTTSKTPTSSDSTSSKSQISSTPTSSTTSSTFTASLEKSRTPIPSKTTSANIQTSAIVSSETSSSRSSSTRTRSSLDSSGSSSASTGSSSTSSMITTPAASELTSTQSEEIPSSPEISTQTTPSLSSSRLPISELTTSLDTSSDSTSSALPSSPSSFSSITSPSTEAGSDGMESSTSATSTTNKYTAKLTKGNEAFTSLEFGSTTLLKTTETPSSSSEPSTTEIFMKSTESSSSAFPSSEATSSSSSSMITTPTASELTSTLPEDPSSSSETRESSVTSSESTTRSFPSTTSESEASSEYHGTVLPSTYSTPITTGTRKPSIIMHSSTETSSVESSSSTFTETRKTKTSSPNTFKTTPTRSEKTTTGGNGVSTSSSITEPTISSTSKPRSSSSSVKSSGATDPATTGSLVSSTSRPRSSFPVKTSRTTKPADPHPSTMFFVRASSSSISKFTTKESTTTSQSVKLQTTDTEETMVSSTPPKVKPSTGGSTSTVVSTTDESPSTEGNSLTFSAEPQSSANPSTTVTLLTSADSSTEHPTTTDSTTSIVSESSSSENPSTAMQNGTTQISSKLSKATPTTIEPKSTEASPATSSSPTKTSPKITSTGFSTTSTTSTPSTAKSSPSSETTPGTSNSILQSSSTQTLSSSATTASKLAPKSSTTSTSTKSTTMNPTTVSKETTTPKSTTTDSVRSQQCPDGYLIGTSYCFRLFPRLVSYQSALAYCKTIDLQTLASLDKIKDNSDIKLIQESAALQNIDWIYANGIGSKDERFLKKASVYSIFNQSLVSSPIVKTVVISQLFTNISALCVMPQYGNKMDCDLVKLFQAYEFYNTFKQTAGILGPRRSGTVTCIYGNQKSTTVTCNNLGAIYPNPTNIDCEESATERQLKDTTNDLVSNCKVCYKRGTKECQKVLDETKQTVKGYQCICRKPYSMSTCWRTVNNCNSTVCGDHGTCMSEMGHMWCDCKWGYTGDHCEEALEKKYKGDIGFSTAAAATITVGDGIYRLLKICVMGLPKGDGGSDPQSTHQTFRWICILCANALIILYSNPTLLAIPLIQCRFTFIAIHFFYVQAMVQWLLEGFNVNQVLRCVHLNEWERDINGNKPFGVRIWPRFIASVIGVTVFVLIPFTAGWNKLAASWTCVGVICEETLHVWFPIFFGVVVIVLWAGAIYENSALIKVRRPLLGFRLDYEIERRVGQEAGKVFQKCRDNELMCFIGVILLVAQWISVIISSDHRDEKFYGMISVVVSGIYSAFSMYQETMTNPEDRATFYTLLQRFLPYRAAPAYNPETTWTIDEVKEYFNTPKKERDDKYEGFINRNQQLFIHHKWDIRMNEFLAEDPKMTINEALIKVFTAEMNELREKNGSGRDRLYIQATFVAYSDTIPHFEPRPTGNLQGHLELVTLAAEDPVQGTRLAKFFIVPTHHIFEPEIPEKRRNAKDNRKKKNLRRRLLKNIEEDIFKLSCEEIHAQAVFANSAILFSHYGNNVVR